MRIIFISLLFLSCLFTTNAQNLIKQDSNGVYFFREILENDFSKDENYNKVKSYIAINYKSLKDVIQLDTKDQIIVKGNFNISHTMTTHTIHHTLTIDIKDKKIRITYNSFRVTVKNYDNLFEDDGNWLTFPNKEKTIKKTSERLSEIIEGLRKHMKTVIKDDW